MRAREPDASGFVERGSVHTYFETFGEGGPTLLLMPTWSIVHSRLWKAQVPYFARRHRVITFDGRGNGRSDRPTGSEHYADIEMVNDAVAILDATGTHQAVVVGASQAGWWATVLAAEHPERVLGLVVVSTVCPLAPPLPPFATFADELPTDEGWAKLNMHYWRRDYPGFLRFFFPNMYPEPHSSKQLEDSIAWALETTAETLIDTVLAPSEHWMRAKEVYASVHCPALVVHGTHDGVVPAEHAELAAEAMNASLMTIEGGGHSPETRDPVRFNLLLSEFIASVAPPTPHRLRWTRALVRPKRALFVSSPIGLGHALRDLATANELRRLHPDLEIDWLAQHPVTEVLRAGGQRVHPASALLASEARHVESEADEHDLHCFQAYRRMDEILAANFMVFHDLVTQVDYDLVVGDEAWDIDYFLHENPELKRYEYCWMTDFVGWLPALDGDEREVLLTADYNTEMIEHIGRFPRLRSRSIFVGNPTDVVTDRLGPGLPTVREWTEANYDFSGYVTGFDPLALGDRDALRAELGYGPDERVCIVTVGGTAVGVHLLRRVISAHPLAAQRVPGLRMIVVAGPRIDPRSLDAPDGVDVHAFVPDLYRHLAACDVAVVQGGLTTTMELTANRRPFLYFPLRRHFEQQIHVRHRLAQYGAGRSMDYATSGPEVIADALADELNRTVDYRPVETDGAARAAALIAELL